jgi:hypothetical protein
MTRSFPALPPFQGCSVLNWPRWAQQRMICRFHHFFEDIAVRDRNMIALIVRHQCVATDAEVGHHECHCLVVPFQPGTAQKARTLPLAQAGDKFAWIKQLNVVSNSDCRRWGILIDVLRSPNDAAILRSRRLVSGEAEIEVLSALIARSRTSDSQSCDRRCSRKRSSRDSNKKRFRSGVHFSSETALTRFWHMWATPEILP